MSGDIKSLRLFKIHTLANSPMLDQKRNATASSQNGTEKTREDTSEERALDSVVN